MQNKPNLIGFGAVAVDDLVFLETFPEPDTKTQVVRRSRAPGGLAGTALVAAARLGAHPAYFGVFDDSELSCFSLQEFSKAGVQTHLCSKLPGAGPLYSTIIIDQSTGGRTILFSVDKFHLPSIQEIRDEKFIECEMIFIDTFSLSILPLVCQIAERLSIPIIADVEHTDILEYKKEFGLIDYLILNKKLAQKMTGQSHPSAILHALESVKRKVSVITAGPDGCWFKEKDKPIFFLPAFKVETVDTTGCGDVFHGAFAAAILEGTSIVNAIIQASAAAALKATKPGGQTGIPSKKELHDFLHQHREITPRVIN